jgi:hypothetical protein
VWTPKRIALMVLGFAVFVAAYAGYAHFLGGIDGLPALPEEYARPADPESPLPPEPDKPNELNEKLTQAFGEECPELDYAIKLEVRDKGTVLAAKDFKLLKDKDGRVLLTHLSLAMFGKNTGDGKYPEINTLRCLKAFLTFDHPIESPADMGKYKLALAELRDQIEVINNRRTPARDDDINVLTQGPVFYKEDEHRIWTASEVPIKLVDLQSKPDPMVITGTGLDLFLTVEEPGAKNGRQTAQTTGKRRQGAGHRPRQASISGVERIVLHQDVEMHLYPDGNSGFLSTAKDSARPAADPKGAAAAARTGPPAKKAHVVIQTQGPFVFDVPRSHARFDVSEHPGLYRNGVLATRIQEEGKYDQLECEHLELQFQQKDDKSQKTVREDRSLDLEIQTAHATGKVVTLSSDSECLNAEGDDFFYDARTRESILKRSGPTEVLAFKEGNEIHAREIRILEQKGAQQVTALGPGWIDLFDKKTNARGQHAEWKDKLVSGRDGAYDLLVLTNEAAFVDRTNKQSLRADLLKVWLEPAPQADAKAEKPAGGGKASDPSEQHGRRPHHVEALGHVVASSPDLNVHDTEHLLIWFQDAPPAPPPAAVAQDSEVKTLPPPAASPSVATGGPPVAKSTAGGPPTATAQGKPAEENKPPRPIDLSARLVEAHVLRSEAKNELDRLWTEGEVKVKQAPANPGEKGVDIQGDTLKMTRQTGGNLLVVTGDLARLLMDKIYIVGPVVNIDQATNKVWVNGIGAMQMDSDQDFEGKKLKEPVPLTVHWSQNMVFEDNWAEFHGGEKGNVLAEQQTSRVLCQTMHVYLDRSVSLKQGPREGPAAKVRTMVCEQKVIVEDIDRDPKGQLVKYQRLECPELAVDNENGVADASGPGVVRILQYGDANDSATSPAGSRPPAGPPANGKPAPQQLQLTRVQYAGTMHANNKNHTAIFTQDVHAVHVPSDDILAEPNIDNLPAGGMYLQTDQLTVYSRPEANGRSSQQMVSDGHCSFRTPEYSGQSDKITYDESKEQVIFIGVPGRPAHLYKWPVRGGEPQETKARRITYLRRTDEFQVEDADVVQSH